MRPSQRRLALAFALSINYCLLFSFLSANVSAKDECQPSTWELEANKLGAIPTSSKPHRPTRTYAVSPKKTHEPGDVNCRGWTGTYEEVNYYSCKEMADLYGISVDLFFKLNPRLAPDCEGIASWTEYCIAGFIQPLRAFDGQCGPKHKNATCEGTDKECCNSETWTCGNSEEDCAPGICYEGACAGHKVYTTDGKCGRDHGFSLCAGKWGDCCSEAGICGSGSDFCGEGKCQLGRCDISSLPNDGPSWLMGNTTDGSCGGPRGYTCNVVHGECCNKDDICGSLPRDCGDGCQPEFGECGVKSSTTSSALCGSPTVSIKTSSSLGCSGAATKSP